MKEMIADEQLLPLSELVARHLGLHFPRERWPDLQRAVCGAALERGYGHDLERYIQELLSPSLTTGQLDGLARHLTVGETYFFREKNSLEVLEKNIVPELIRIRSRGSIGIWSAGCSTGEEAFSIAMMLQKFTAGPLKREIEILATDLNSMSLDKASQGIYGEWSFRGIPAWVRNAHFEPAEGGRWAIRSAIKKMVNFSQLNLMDDSPSPVSTSGKGLDVIFCRNVLMYFTPEGMKKVIRRLYRSLASDGWLIVSPTETSHQLFCEFAAVNFGDVTLYRKSSTHSSTTRAFPMLDADRPALQWAESTIEVPQSARIPPARPTLEVPPDQSCVESTTPPTVSYGRALALYEQGRYEDLERMIVALPPQDEEYASAMLLLAHSYANQGRLATALAWCDKTIAADKMAARAYYLRATILQEQGSLPEALFAFQQTIYAEPQFVLGHFCLGNLALNRGELRESEKHFKNVLLLLARYNPEDIVPESQGISAGKLTEMIVSQRSVAAPIAPKNERSQRAFRHSGKPRAGRSRGL